MESAFAGILGKVRFSGPETRSKTFCGRSILSKILKINKLLYFDPLLQRNELRRIMRCN